VGSGFTVTWLKVQVTVSLRLTGAFLVPAWVLHYFRCNPGCRSPAAFEEGEGSFLHPRPGKWLYSQL